MATLNRNIIKKNKRYKALSIIIIFIMQLVCSPVIIYAVHQMFEMLAEGNVAFATIQYSYKDAVKLLWNQEQVQLMFIGFEILFLCLILYLSLAITPTIGTVEVREVTKDIEIPVAAGNGQHGNERFLTEDEKNCLFECFVFSGKEKMEKKGGVVVNFTKDKVNEKIYYIEKDIHTLIIGATRSGKTRRILLETIGLQILSGLSIIVSDVKGEIYYFTHEFAEKHGYKTIAFDLRSPKKSVHYNFLQPILDSLDDRAKAIDYTWDLVSVLVGEPKGEPLWTNGESATIAAAILAVCIEAPAEYRNLTNVYYFLAYMCQPDLMGEMPLNAYISTLEVSHPARAVFAMATIAADKTRSSFFTSALGTLRLFTNPNIAEMTSKSDFSLKDIGREKSILYMIIPDEKKTLYSIVSVLITQLYTMQVELANESGLRLPIPTDYDLDEVGNFPRIPVLGAILSAGASRGVRANLIIQDYQQLESKYKEDFKNIRTNCQAKIYLKSDDPDTLKSISSSLGNYTVEVSAASTSVNDNNKLNTSYSSSANLTGRALLEMAEIKRIKSPYALCMLTGEYPAINELPDLSEYYFNELFGLGNEEFNTKIIAEREEERKERKITDIPLWGIWDDIGIKQKASKPKERISFL